MSSNGKQTNTWDRSFDTATPPLLKFAFTKRFNSFGICDVDIEPNIDGTHYKYALFTNWMRLVMSN